MIIGAPYTVTADVLEKVFNVDMVIHGKTDVLPDLDGGDPYALPKERGIYLEVETPFSSALGTDTIIERIVQNRKLYEARNRRKQEKAALEEKLLLEERKRVNVLVTDKWTNDGELIINDCPLIKQYDYNQNVCEAYEVLL